MIWASFSLSGYELENLYPNILLLLKYINILKYIKTV